MVSNTSKKDVMSMADFQNIVTGCPLDDDFMAFDTSNGISLEKISFSASFDMLFLCLSGKGEICIDGVNSELVPDVLCVIMTNHEVRRFHVEPGSRILGIAFSHAFFQHVIQDVRELAIFLMFNNSYHTLELKESQVTSMYHYLMVIKDRILNQDHRFRKEIVHLLFHAMSYDLANLLRNVKQVSDDTFVASSHAIFINFLRLLEENYMKEHRVSWYADRLNITPKYLSETVRRVSGTTPGEWVDIFIVKELKHLLEETTLDIREISDRLHFSNQSFMGKYFKKHVGVSPTKFRKG